MAVDDFKASADILYPVKIDITGIDRYHLLKEIITCIVDNHKLSMNSLCTETTDNIVHCSIDFSVHSANELREVTDAISSIEGVEEVKSL